MICTFELIASRKYKRQTLKQLTLRKSFVLLIERVDIRKQESFLSSSRSTSSSLNQRPNAVSRLAGVSSWLRMSCGPSTTNGPTQYQGLRGSTGGYTERADPSTPADLACQRRKTGNDVSCQLESAYGGQCMAGDITGRSMWHSRDGPFFISDDVIYVVYYIC